ncbi:MAG: TadE/TadG family type IV pilus assembly protein [Pseudomonadota bacterium]
MIRKVMKAGRRFWRERRGAAMVEFAFMAPVLALLALGGAEAGRYVLAQQKVSRMASNISDLTSREPQLSNQDIDQVFDAAEFIMSPFSVGGNTIVIISSVSKDADGDPVLVNWQRSGAGSMADPSRIGVPGGNATLPNGVDLRAGQDAIIAESFYSYEPLVGSDIFNDTVMYSVAMTAPRFGALTADPIDEPTD